MGSSGGAAGGAAAPGTYVPAAGLVLVTAPTGVAATDTANIQSAITAAGDLGTVLFREGTYTHSGLTSDALGQTWKSLGKTVLQTAAGVIADAIQINTTTTFKNPFRVENIDVLGVSGSGHGLNIRYASVVTLKNCRFNGHGGDGIRTFETTAMACYSVEARGNGGNGLSGGQKQDGSVFVGCNFFSNTGWGVVLDVLGTSGARNNANAFVGGAITQNALGGLWVRGASTNGTNLTGVYIENNGTVQNVKIGEAGLTVGPTVVKSCYVNGSTFPLAFDVYQATAFVLEDSFVESHATGAVKLNAVVNFEWRRTGTTTAGFQVQTSNSRNITGISSGGTLVLNDNSSQQQHVAQNGQTSPLLRFLDEGLVERVRFRPDGFLTIGTPSVSPGATVDLNLIRSDTQGALLRVEQQGAGTAGTAVANFLADGTSTTAYALFARSKGTGNIALFNNASGSMLTIATAAVTVGTLLLTLASATASSGLRLPHGAAPTSPANGDVWTTSSGLFVQIAGVTKTVTVT